MYEKEKQLIKDRIEEIKKRPRTTTEAGPIQIVYGCPIFQAQAPEFKSLHRMAEILEFNKQAFDGEYLLWRKHTELDPIDPELERILSAPAPQKDDNNKKEAEPTISAEKVIDDEMSAIDKRKSELIASISYNYTAPSYMQTGSTSMNDELSTLQRMSELLKEDMTDEEKKQYNNLRNKTKMSAMSDDNKKFFQNTMEEGAIEDDSTYEDDKPIGEPANNTFANNRMASSAQAQTDNSATYDAMSQMIDQAEAQQNPQPGAAAIGPEADFIYDENGNLISTPEPSGSQTPPPNATDADFTEIPDFDVGDNLPPENTPNDEPEEIVKSTRFQWIKKHKKQILIACGITALTITVVIAFTQLWPAVVASSKASQVAFMAEKMVSNAGMWHISDAASQLALHSNSVGLAQKISEIAGIAANFTNSTGVWTLGGQSLFQFAAGAAETATAAAAKVQLFGGLTAAGAALTTGFFRGSILAGRKLSAKYKEIKSKIDKMKIAASNLTEEEQTTATQMISNEIIASKELSDRERNILFKKLQNALNKMKKANAKKAPQPVEDIPEEEYEDNFEGEPAMAM